VHRHRFRPGRRRSGPGPARVPAQQGLGLHHDSRRAVAALRRAGQHEAVRPPGTLGLAQALGGDDLAALEPPGRLGTGDDRLVAGQYRARPARALWRASVLDRKRPALLRSTSADARPAEVHRDRSAVEDEFHRALPSVLSDPQSSPGCRLGSKVQKRGRRDSRGRSCGSGLTPVISRNLRKCPRLSSPAFSPRVCCRGDGRGDEPARGSVPRQALAAAAPLGGWRAVFNRW